MQYRTVPRYAFEQCRRSSTVLCSSFKTIVHASGEWRLEGMPSFLARRIHKYSTVLERGARYKILLRQMKLQLQALQTKQHLHVIAGTWVPLGARRLVVQRKKGNYVHQFLAWCFSSRLKLLRQQREKHESTGEANGRTSRSL